MIEPVSKTVFNPDELMKKLNEGVGVLNQTAQESAKKDILIDQYTAENMQLKHELSKLKTLVFSAKSERFQGQGAYFSKSDPSVSVQTDRLTGCRA